MGDHQYGARLFDQHADLLTASAISPEVAAARGYVTADQLKRIRDLGFARAVSVPGLLIPVHNTAGEVALHEYRPDVPRVDANGKPRKYEKPWRSTNVVDVPPPVRDQVKDITIPLWITEGARKADAAVTAGLCCVSLAGVDCWRNKQTALPDWEEIALRGRKVLICFDSDVMTKPTVAKALKRLSVFLDYRGADVHHVTLPGEGGKVGLDDYFAAGGTVDELAEVTQPWAPYVKQTSLSTPPNGTATPQQSRSADMPPVAVLRRILDRVAEEVRGRGLVGEERLAQTIYLVLTSRLLDKQVSAGVKGHSASGKSYTVETVVRMFPAEAYLEFTAMSERALVYSPDDYAHRTLIVYEITALREGVEDDMTSYFVRSLLSEGRIEYPVTVRGADGEFTTRTIIKEGPTNLIFTTTKTRVHAENETRIMSLATDDSREQTARVLLELAEEDHNGGGMDEWHQLQRWLAGAEHRVTIPYARTLAEKIPPVAVRLRRDFGSLLALVRAHAILHQATRERDDAGRIVADLDDYAVVRDLVAENIAEGVGATVSVTVRQTVLAVAAMCGTEGVALTALADKLNLDKSNVSRRIRQAADGGYVRNLEDKKGKLARWITGDPLPESAALLPDPAQLRNGPQLSEQDRCGVAHESEGDREACAVDGCTSPPRRACRTCWEHAGMEIETVPDWTEQEQEPF